jgi:hypothetical protein
MNFSNMNIFTLQFKKAHVTPRRTPPFYNNLNGPFLNVLDPLHHVSFGESETNPASWFVVTF